MKKSMRVPYIILFFLLLCITLKKIFVGIDVDEIAACAQAFRIIKGDIFFKDMWEAQMTSNLLIAAMMKIWIVISGGTTGAALFIRICSVLLQIAMSYFCYCSLRHLKISKNWRVIIAMIFYLYGTKRMIIPEYSNLQSWLPILIFMCMINYFYGERNRWWLVSTGLFFSILILAYPTYLALLLVYISGLCLMNKEMGRSRRETLFDLGVIATACMACTLVLFAFLFRHQTPDELIRNIQYMMNISRHNFSFLEKLTNYQEQIKAELKVFLMFGTITAVLFGLLAVLRKIKTSVKNFMALFLLVDFIGEMYLCIENNRDWNLRYIVLLAVVGILYSVCTPKICFLFGVLPGIIGYLAALWVSEVGVIGFSYGMLWAAAFPALIMLVLHFDKEENSIIKKYVVAGTLLYMAYGFCFFVRTSSIPQNVFQHEAEMVTQGPLKGIFFQEAEKQYYDGLLDYVEDYVNDGENICYIGMNDSVYLMRNGTLNAAIPSVVWDDWKKGDVFRSYFELNPEKKPDVCIFNKTYDFGQGLRIDMAALTDEKIIDWMRRNYSLIYEDEHTEIYR